MELKTKDDLMTYLNMLKEENESLRSEFNQFKESNQEQASQEQGQSQEKEQNSQSQEKEQNNQSSENNQVDDKEVDEIHQLLSEE